jgi:hypothetical protein
VLDDPAERCDFERAVSRLKARELRLARRRLVWTNVTPTAEWVARQNICAIPRHTLNICKLLFQSQNCSKLVG